ncbi:porin family protein [Neiella marina]|uniref:Porin family protein n=1 Tax=Neiella holothuriorum TaxID=2870530 RepID=A0ABS7EKN3_9GAMM|nr:outer membrane beta-barrel protein [Neiella holothuriorum]MBW8192921.1 porin family protein [Neiella holothuriorum]
MLRMLSLSLILLLPSAFAARWELINPPLTSPLYIGGGVGYGQFDADYVDTEWQANWQFYGGYRFQDVWAIEFAGGRYADAEGVSDSLPSVDIEHSFNLSASLLGYAYYTDFAAFYRMGVQYDDYDIIRYQQESNEQCASDDERTMCAASDSQFSFLVGLGGEFPITDALVTRLEWISQLGGDDFNQHQAIASIMLKF